MKLKQIYQGAILKIIFSGIIGLLLCQQTLLAQQLTYTPYTFTTFAGSPGNRGTADGTNETARLNRPGGIAIDSSNNLYVADQYNHLIRKITPEGVVTTLAGTAGNPGLRDGTNSDALFDNPSGAVVDSSGNIYVADLFNNAIREITPSGTNWITTTIAGNGTAGSNDGTNTMAEFSHPHDLALDATGNIFVADQNNYTIREITSSGTNWIVTTIAGQAGVRATVDGTNSGANFYFPESITVSTDNKIFVADNTSVRQITPAGTNWIVSTIAGATFSVSPVDGTNNTATFGGLHGIEVVNSTNIFITDTTTSLIRKMTLFGTNWVVTTLGGSADKLGWSDGAGSVARFYSPCSTVADTGGNLFVADFANDTIRKGLPFAITNQPQSQGALMGTNATLGVSVFGDGPFFYQWNFNGMPLQNQTNATLDLTSVQRADSGFYSVMVTNLVAGDAIFSSNALLRVLVSPVMQLPQFSTDGVVRLQFQDADGGVPYDLNYVQVQWRAALPNPPDTNWQTLAGHFYLTNGVVEFDDTNAFNLPNCFYRIVEF